MHDETLHIIFLIRAHLTRAVEHVLKFSAFKDHRLEADFSKEIAVVERGNNDADAARESRVVAHDPIRSAGSVIGARGPDRVEVGDHRLIFGEISQRIVENIRCRHLTAGGIHFHDHRFHMVIPRSLLESGLEILHHRIPKAAAHTKADDTVQWNNRDLGMRIRALGEHLLLVFCLSKDFDSRHRGRASGPD